MSYGLTSTRHTLALDTMLIFALTFSPRIYILYTKRQTRQIYLGEIFTTTFSMKEMSHVLLSVLPLRLVLLLATRIVIALVKTFSTHKQVSLVNSVYFSKAIDSPLTYRAYDTRASLFIYKIIRTTTRKTAGMCLYEYLAYVFRSRIASNTIFNTQFISRFGNGKKTFS